MEVTIASLKKTYLKTIPKKIRVDVEKWIDDKACQEILNRAIKYELTESDYHFMNMHGNWNNCDFPKLRWVCAIYIHPLTTLGAIANKADKYI